MNADTTTRLTKERLVELREWCQPRPNQVQGVKQPRNSWQGLTDALDELLAYRESERWVPWKPGDALPMQAMYLVTMDDGFLGITDAANFEANFVIAYLPTALPAPYSQGSE